MENQQLDANAASMIIYIMYSWRCRYPYLIAQTLVSPENWQGFLFVQSGSVVWSGHTTAL